MKTTLFKFFGFFMTVFTVSQVYQADKVLAHAPELNPQDKSTYTTDEHGGGCCCNTCAVPVQDMAQN